MRDQEEEEPVGTTAALYGLIQGQNSRQKSQQFQTAKPMQLADLVAPDQHAQLIPIENLGLISPAHLNPDSKVSSLMESPMAPVTEGPKVIQTDKGGVKDFSNRYLKEGMWPGKISAA